MELERVTIADLKPHPANYNRHPSVAKLTDSLRLNGQYKNIVVSSDGYIIAGHGLVMAAKELGISELYAKREDCLHDSPEAQRILVADNLTPEESDPDNTALAALLSSLQQTVGLEGTGSDDVALDALCGSLNEHLWGGGSNEQTETGETLDRKWFVGFVLEQSDKDALGSVIEREQLPGEKPSDALSRLIVSRIAQEKP